MVVRTFYRTMGLMDKCYLVKRGRMYDVYLSGKMVGSGQLAYISTAYHVYREEGYDVEIIDE